MPLYPAGPSGRPSTDSNTSPDRAKAYLLALINYTNGYPTFTESGSSQLLYFPDPEAAGKALQFALRRVDYGESLGLLRAMGFEVYQRTLAAVISPGDVWAAITFPFRPDTHARGSWADYKRSRAMADRQRRVEDPSVYYGGCGKQYEPRGPKEPFSRQDALGFGLGFYYMVEVAAEVGS